MHILSPDCLLLTGGDEALEFIKPSEDDIQFGNWRSFEFGLLRNQESLRVNLFQALDGGDVWMIERSQNLGFALEARMPFGVTGEYVRQELECDSEIEGDVVSQKNLAHPTLPQLFEDPGMRDILADNGHGCLRQGDSFIAQHPLE
jgi:hypothetical protein